MAAPGENMRVNGDRLWDSLMEMAKIGPGIAGGNNRQTLTDADAEGSPVAEIRSYIRRKLEMARDFPRESRLFANEVLQGAPNIEDELKGPLKSLVDEKAEVIRAWAKAGKIAKCDPYHLIFSIWSTTQHYADFDVQVRAVLGQDNAGDGRFEDAARFLEQLFVTGLDIHETAAE